VFLLPFWQASPPPSPILQFHSRCSLAIHMLCSVASRVLSTCYPYEPCYPSATYYVLFVVWALWVVARV
jgi:hypothetical protein